MDSPAPQDTAVDTHSAASCRAQPRGLPRNAAQVAVYIGAAVLWHRGSRGSSGGIVSRCRGRRRIGIVELAKELCVPIP